MTDLSKRVNGIDESWIDICALGDLPYDAGVAALLNENTSAETQLALFLPTDSDRVYAINNLDPFSDANVLARGIVCSIGDELAVASPVHKEHFSLTTGKCFEDDAVAVATYPTKIDQGRVFVHANPAAPAGEV
ncbi:MAG: nitrite reductase small subunit NirD [Porticoccaceae bacterium]|nr:nitrite reductase small subunit NirD [Porticoccaceae bacterium]